jgi:regulator of protease activity HflC (stomatin/prohibitin superfamily)
MIFTAVFLLVFVSLSLLLGTFKKETFLDKDEDLNPKGIIKFAGVLVLSLVVSFINPISVERIDVGHIGMKVNNAGDEKGLSQSTYVTGWVFYNTWISRIIEYPVTQQHIDYEAETIITRGGFQATIKPSFNWSVNPQNASDMYQNLRQGVKEIEQGWLKNAIIGAVNDIANLYTVDSIFNHRAEFETEIVKESNKRVSKWFNVSQLRTNILPPKEITESINAKTKAVQDAQAAIQQKIVAEAQAQTKIATAKGDSAEAVIAAAGRAEAVRKEQQYLTPMYIEYIKVQKWNGDVPTTVLGSNGSVLLNLPK